MRKNLLYKLITQYDENCSAFLDENIHIKLLKFFLESPAISSRKPDEDITFSEFKKFIIDNFVEDDLTVLFKKEYLSGSKNSAGLFRQFIASDPSIGKEDDITFPQPKRVKPPIAKPDRTRAFSQSALIMNANILSYLQLEPAVLDWRGVCNGLTTIWYEHLIKGGDLINDLDKMIPDPVLIKKIRATQMLGGTLSNKAYVEPTLANIEESRERQKTLKLPPKPPLRKFLFFEDEASEKKFKEPDTAIARMSFLEFSEAIEQSLPLRQFESYLNKLQESHRSEIGLHTIIIGLKGRGGHAIGWTYFKNQYILFDSNMGESYFNHFDSFKSFVCDYIHHRGYAEILTIPKTLSVTDFYSETDLEELPKHKPK